MRVTVYKEPMSTKSSQMVWKILTSFKLDVKNSSEDETDNEFHYNDDSRTKLLKFIEKYHPFDFEYMVTYF